MIKIYKAWEQFNIPNEKGEFGIVLFESGNRKNFDPTDYQGILRSRHRLSQNYEGVFYSLEQYPDD